MKKRNGREQGHKVSNRKAAGCVQGKLIPCFMQNVYPSKRPGHLRREIYGKLAFDLEDSDLIENTKVTASEKPWLNQSMAKSAVL